MVDHASKYDEKGRRRRRGGRRRRVGTNIAIIIHHMVQTVKRGLKMPDNGKETKTQSFGLQNHLPELPK